MVTCRAAEQCETFVVATLLVLRRILGFVYVGSFEEAILHCNSTQGVTSYESCLEECCHSRKWSDCGGWGQSLLSTQRLEPCPCSFQRLFDDVRLERPRKLLWYCGRQRSQQGCCLVLPSSEGRSKEHWRLLGVLERRESLVLNCTEVFTFMLLGHSKKEKLQISRMCSYRAEVECVHLFL